MEGSRSETRAVDLAGSRVLVDDDQPTFWDRVEIGRWEPATLRLLAAIVLPGTTFVDLGAWVGPLTLLAPARGARVIAVEADPAALGQLRRNLAANPLLADRVTVVPCAISPSAAPVRLGARRKPGDSMSSALLPGAAIAWEAQAITAPELGSLIGDVNDVVVKLDIEGGEYALLPALASVLDRPETRILVSFHPGILREAGLDPRLAADRASAALHDWAAYAVDGDPMRLDIDADAIESHDLWLFTKEARSAP